MNIPDFQSVMLPIMDMLNDGYEHSSKDIVNNISDIFKLNSEERNQTLESGVIIINNRIGWALSYLKKANLINATKRAVYKITPDGIKVVQSQPKAINIGFLKTLPAFIEWQKTFQNKEVKNNGKALTEIEPDTSKTPQELLEFSYTTLKEKLADDLLETIKTSSPSFFEKLVIDLLIKMGYGGSRKDAGQITGKSGDGGIDGVIKEDKLGLDIIYVQAKKWVGAVDISSVRDFAGSLLSKKAKKGIFITTSSYPKSAYDFVQSIEHKIILIDGKELADLMIENNVGVSPFSLYEVKKIDSDYFDESN